jgi:hypothetical protein
MQHRIRQTAGGRQGVTEIVMRFEKVRSKRDRRTVVRACVVISFQRGEQVSEIVVRTGRAWIDGDRFFELGDSLVVAAKRCKCVAKIIVRLGSVALESIEAGFLPGSQC